MKYIDEQIVLGSLPTTVQLLPLVLTLFPAASPPLQDFTSDSSLLKYERQKIHEDYTDLRHVSDLSTSIYVSHLFKSNFQQMNSSVLIRAEL